MELKTGGDKQNSSLFGSQKELKDFREIHEENHIILENKEILLTKNKLKKSKHACLFNCVECSRSWCKKDKEDSLKLQEWLEVYNPLDRKDASLRNVYTGVTARITNKINCDDVEKVGKGIHQTLDNKAFIQSSLKRKAQITTLESLNVGVNIEKEKVYVDPSILFS